MDAVAYREGVWASVQKDAGPEGSGRGGIKFVPQPAEVVDSIGRGRWSGLDLHCCHTAIWDFEDEVYFAPPVAAILVVAPVLEGAVLEGGGNLAGDLVYCEGLQ